MFLTFDVAVHLTKELLGTKCLQCTGTVKVKDEFLPLLPILYAALRIIPKEMKALMWNFAWEKNGTNTEGKARTVRLWGNSGSQGPQFNFVL